MYLYLCRICICLQLQARVRSDPTWCSSYSCNCAKHAPGTCTTHPRGGKGQWQWQSVEHGQCVPQNLQLIAAYLQQKRKRLPHSDTLRMFSIYISYGTISLFVSFFISFSLSLYLSLSVCLYLFLTVSLTLLSVLLSLLQVELAKYLLVFKYNW